MRRPASLAVTHACIGQPTPSPPAALRAGSYEAVTLYMRVRHCSDDTRTLELTRVLRLLHGIISDAKGDCSTLNAKLK